MPQLEDPFEVCGMSLWPPKVYLAETIAAEFAVCMELSVKVCPIVNLSQPVSKINVYQLS